MTWKDRFTNNYAFLLINFMFISSIQGQSFKEKPLVEYAKCCPLGKGLSENGDCVDSSLRFDLVFSIIQNNDTHPTEVGFIIGLNCAEGRYRLEPQEYSDEEFKLLTNGSLYLPHQKNKILNATEYCLESFKSSSGEVTILPLICVPPAYSWKEIASTLYSAGCLISIPFLVATLVVYSCTSFLRTDINSKILSCHVASLTIAYTSLSIVLTYGKTLPSIICISLAFCIQFSFLASFFWLNVLCFSTWRKLRKNSDPFAICSSQLIKSRRSKRYLYYSLYAWGMPTLFVVITLGMDMSPSVPSAYLKPNFGTESCWFRDDTPALPYFYAPIVLILIANLIMFIFMVFSVNKTNKNMQQKRKTLRDVVRDKLYQKRKGVFIECTVLFLIMGFNWTFEVISWAIKGPSQMWFITDLYNTLQGIIVFYVFVYREPRPWQSFKAYLKCTIPQDLDFELFSLQHRGDGYTTAPIR